MYLAVPTGTGGVLKFKSSKRSQAMITARMGMRLRSTDKGLWLMAKGAARQIKRECIFCFLAGKSEIQKLSLFYDWVGVKIPSAEYFYVSYEAAAKCLIALLPEII